MDKINQFVITHKEINLKFDSKIKLLVGAINKDKSKYKGYLLFVWNSLIFNYLFGYYILFIILTCYSSFESNVVCNLVKFSIIFIFLIVILNMAIQYRAILDFIKNPSNGHPYFRFLLFRKQT